MTTNNDTPQVFGPGAHDADGFSDDDFPPAWREHAASPPRTQLSDDEDAPAADGGADPGADRVADRGVEDRADRGAEGAADEGDQRGEPNTRSGPDPLSAEYPSSYPQPAFYPRDLEYPQGAGYVPVPREQSAPRNQPPASAPPNPGQPGYPSGPGYALDADYAHDAGYGQDSGYTHDAGYNRELSYPQDPGYGPEADYEPEAGYQPEAGYAHDPGYRSDNGFGPDSGFRPDSRYGPGSGYGRQDGPGADQGFLANLGFTTDADADADAVPPMEPLPGLAAPEPTGSAPAQDPAPRWDLGSPPADTAARAAAGAGLREDVAAPPPEPMDTRETSESLTTESLLHGKRAAPGTGWRRGVYRATGGLLKFGESAAEMRRRDLINRVRTPVAGGHHRVAVLSLKGGVGKTTTAVGLGATLATLRGDRVIAVDANPDRGTLSDKVRLETAATIRDLLNERDLVRRYADVRAFTSQAPSRLEVLASDRDPGVSVAFGADDYCDAARVLEHFYSICITDCGTGLLHSAMSGVLRLADQIVLVSSPSVDGARSASATLDWLEAHNCGDLVRNGVVVLSAIRPKSKSTVDLDRLEHHFAARCRAVTRIPYDPHLEEGAEVELELLNHDTADAYLALAALVGDGLARPRR